MMKLAFAGFLVAALLSFSSVSASAQEASDGIEVSVEGSAAGDPSLAREQALADALRNAVRQGIGVDLISETKVENFKTEYDRVMTSSFGYVEEHQVLSQKYSDGVYTVKIKAKVKKGSPGTDNVLALRLLVRRMGSPRVLIKCEEKIFGVEGSSPVAEAILEEMAKKTGFETFDKEAVDDRNSAEAARAAILGDQLDEKVKKAGVSSKYDMIISGSATGEIGPLEEPFPEVKTRDISIGYNLKAVWADTGETLAAAKCSAMSFQAKSPEPVTLPRQLVRKYLGQVMEEGDPKDKGKNAYDLFRKILAKWVVELDLGSKMTIEIKKIDKPAMDKLVADLEKAPGVAYVWRREFDPRLISTVEVEARMNSEALEAIALKSLGSKFTSDQVTKRKLRLMPK